MVIVTSKNKPLVTYNGYEYRLHRRSKNSLAYWACLKEKSQKCNGRLTTLNFDQDLPTKVTIIRTTSHVCTPNMTTMHVRKQLARAKQQARNENNGSILRIVQDDIIEPLSFNSEGYDILTKFPLHDSIKSTLYRIRRTTVSNNEISKHNELVDHSSGSSISIVDSCNKRLGNFFLHIHPKIEILSS